MNEQTERDLVEFAHVQAKATRAFFEALIENGFHPAEALSLARARVATSGANVA